MDKYHLTEEAQWLSVGPGGTEGKSQVEITINGRDTESYQCCASERLDSQWIISRAGVGWEWEGV